MARQVALLRAVNVGGVKVAMADLRRLASDLGWSGVETYVNSGNLIFDAGVEPPTATKRLEAALKERYGRAVPVMLRTHEELAGVLERQPFRGAQYEERRLHVAFLAGKAKSGAQKKLADIDPEECVIDGKEAFLHYPNGVGRSKLTLVVLERAFGVKATVRGVKTVSALVDKSRPH
jgi:uncharacterized protein (DUF1697 family)